MVGALVVHPPIRVGPPADGPLRSHDRHSPHRRACEDRPRADRAAAGRSGRRGGGRRRCAPACERARQPSPRVCGRRRSTESCMMRPILSSDGQTLTLRVPLRIRQRVGRKKVVAPDVASWAPRPRVDSAMVKALARAFRWQRMLDEGVCGTIEELARRERVNGGYEPSPAADAACAGRHRGDTRRAATGGDAVGGSAGWVSGGMGRAGL
jgi:hypothetical protein